jgi:hypothetical protein
MRSLVIVFALVACGGNDKPSPDAPTQIDAALCQTPADCPCFSNYDCPEGFTCKSMGATVACVAGQRGTGAPGTVCTGEQDCASALCVEDATGGFRCSDVCRTAQTCPPELPRCVSLGTDGLCAREPPSQ